MSSLFEDDDWKHKFSVNVETGLWQDFKAHRVGNFIQLVAQHEKISYKRAESQILFDSTLEDYPTPAPPTEITSNALEIDTSSWIPLDVYSCYSKNPVIKLAWKYLWERKLFNTDFVEDEAFYFAQEGEYKNRIIIPFRKPSGSVCFFQARALLNDYPKYLNPDSTQVKASQVLYPFKSDEPVFLF